MIVIWTPVREVFAQHSLAQVLMEKRLTEGLSMVLGGNTYDSIDALLDVSVFHVHL